MTHSPAVDIVRPATEVDWRYAQILIDELIEWDVDQSSSFGFGRAEVVSAFYPDSLENVRRVSATPEGSFLIAIGTDGPAGCAAFHRWSSEVCELYSVYVRPSYRGSGIGSLLIGRLRNDAMASGYRAIYLETAAFMHSAHRLYRASGFEVCEHYRARSARLRKATISMHCELRM
jgi:N-acetylglutamate synthase-like GNAT family acetyltransferase